MEVSNQCQCNVQYVQNDLDVLTFFGHQLQFTTSVDLDNLQTV